jgi:hypothetical protein
LINHDFYSSHAYTYFISLSHYQDKKFLQNLPAPDVSVFADKLDTAARKIYRSLPNTRYGSSTDHYGYKRCASSVVAFKKLWNESVFVFEGVDADLFALYATKSTEILDRAVSFDDEKDNKYKVLCAKKLDTALKRLLKRSDLTDSAAVEATKTKLGEYIKTA